MCAIACINICAHVKDPKHRQPYLSLDTRIQHALFGMGSAALAAAVALLRFVIIIIIIIYLLTARVVGAPQMISQLGRELHKRCIDLFTC